MNKKEFLDELLNRKEDLLNNYEYQKEVLIDLIEAGLSYSKRKLETKDKNFARMMFQMSICKMSSIIQLSGGLKLEDRDNEFDGLIDVYSITTIFRSVFENYCFFKNLYGKNWKEEEFLLLSNIWQISSLNQRHKLLEKNTITFNDDKLKIEKEKEHVNKLNKEIEKLSIYEENKKEIKKFIKENKWQLTIDNNKLQYISWREMYKWIRESKGHVKNDRVYKILSLDSHPSYFSVFQFGELFTQRMDLIRRNSILYSSVQILSWYISDFKDLTSIKSNVKIKDRTLYYINFFNKKE